MSMLGIATISPASYSTPPPFLHLYQESHNFVNPSGSQTCKAIKVGEVRIHATVTIYYQACIRMLTSIYLPVLYFTYCDEVPRSPPFFAVLPRAWLGPLTVPWQTALAIFTTTIHSLQLVIKHEYQSVFVLGSGPSSAKF